MSASRACSLAAAIALAACASDPRPPPPLLPPENEARPLPGFGIPPNAPAEAQPADPARPPPTGDRELDALRLGFHGCQVMGLRIMPSMSGKALLHARLGGNGEVLDVQPVLVEGLPHPVVSCLVERVWNQRFDPRGGDGSVLVIPVDFTRGLAREAPKGNATTAPRSDEATPTQSL